MYLLIHDYGIVLALSYGLIGGVLKSQQECALHVSSPCSWPSGNFTTQKYCDIQTFALTWQFKENFIFYYKKLNLITVI